MYISKPNASSLIVQQNGGIKPRVRCNAEEKKCQSRALDYSWCFRLAGTLACSAEPTDDLTDTPAPLYLSPSLSAVIVIVRPCVESSGIVPRPFSSSWSWKCIECVAVSRRRLRFKALEMDPMREASSMA